MSWWKLSHIHNYEDRYDSKWVLVNNVWQKEAVYVRDICIDCGATVERMPPTTVTFVKT